MRVSKGDGNSRSGRALATEIQSASCGAETPQLQFYDHEVHEFLQSGNNWSLTARLATHLSEIGYFLPAPGKEGDSFEKEGDSFVLRPLRHQSSTMKLSKLRLEPGSEQLVPKVKHCHIIWTFQS